MTLCSAPVRARMARQGAHLLNGVFVEQSSKGEFDARMVGIGVSKLSVSGPD